MARPHSAPRSVVSLLLVAAALTAQTDGPRVLHFPRHGLRVTVPDGWSASQWRADTIVLLARDTARVAVYPPTTTAATLWALAGGEGPLPEAWSAPVQERGPARRRGVVGRELPVGDRQVWVGRVAGDPARAPVVQVGPAGDAAALKALLDGFELVRYGNPRRHVDWAREFSLDVPEGWVCVSDAAGRSDVPGIRTHFVPADCAADPEAAPLRLSIGGGRGEGGGGPFPKGPVSPEERRRILDLVVARGDGAPTLWDESWSVALSREEALERRFRLRGLDGPGRTPLVVLTGRSVGGFVVWLDVRRSTAPKEEALVLVEAAQDALDSFVARADAGVAEEPDGGTAARSGFDREDAPVVSFVLPRGWVERKAASRMRLAEYRVAGDSPLELVVYFFGAGNGGSAAANTERWVAQFDPLTRSSVRELAVAEGIEATVVDVSGTYAAAVRPGASERHREPGHRMLAATLEVAGGPLFLKVVGPEKAIEALAPDFLAWVRSFRRGGR